MKRWYGLGQAEQIAPITAIGVYDGVHRGHRLLIRRGLSDARRSGHPMVVVTFSPNPAEVVRDRPPTRLATLDHRLLLIESLGVDAVLVLDFDEHMSQLSPAQFVNDVLVDALGSACVVVGENFRFGYRASGDVDALRTHGAPSGMTVDAVPLLREELVGRPDVPISSTEIRRLVAAGEIAATTRALARPHRVEGEVVLGDQRGRTMGYPTANLATTTLAAVPGDGVYAGRLVVAPYTPTARAWPAAVSVGTNPTFGGEERRVEAFVLDAPTDFDVYQAHVAVDFVAKVRDQMTFRGEKELITRMAADVTEVRRLLGL